MCVRWVVSCGALALALAVAAQLPLPPPPPPQPQALPMALPLIAEYGEGGGGDTGSLLSLLARHGALGGHALARKSVRSPSRRLRFGRTDPDMPAQPPASESFGWADGVWRSRRAPLRLRFGRRAADQQPDPMRSDAELMAPLLFDNDMPQMVERELRSPAMRLRFGRSSGEDPEGARD